MLNNYFSRDEVAQFRIWMDWADNYVIVSHVSPDGDAAGSSLALALFLRSKGKNVTVTMPDSIPDFLNWIPGAESIVTFDREPEKIEELMYKADVICCLDFNVIGRVSGIAASLLYSKARKIMIDHHPLPGPFCDSVLSRPEASSTSELVFHFLCALGEWDSVTRQMAECICTGMITDTGGFAYNSNDSRFFDAVSLLIEKGVDKGALYNRIFHNYSENRLRMSGYVLSEKMTLLENGRIAMITLSKAELDRFRSVKGDTEGFVNLPLQISGVLFSVFMREDSEKGVVKLSFRSVGDVPCNRFASDYFHGGGHKNASGGQFCGDIDGCVKAFEDALKEWRKTDDRNVRIIFGK